MSEQCRIYTTRSRIVDFDCLFPKTQGIKWPEAEGSPLAVLIRGSTGSGKSTLALQLACFGEMVTIAEDALDTPMQELPHAKPSHRRCVFYYVIDDIFQRIREKYNRFVSKNPKRTNIRILEECIATDGPSISASSLRKNGGIEPGETALFLVAYHGDRTFEKVRSLIRKDVREIGHLVDECIVVIDSISPLMWPKKSSSSNRIESFFSDFPKKRPSVIILVDEEESIADRDPYITDVFIKLLQSDIQNAQELGYCERYLQIVKASNCLHVRGPQRFRISEPFGIQILPSLIARTHTLEDEIIKKMEGNSPQGDKPESISIGLQDLKLDREVQRGSSIVLKGPRGTSKTPIALQFCMEGLKSGAKAAYISLHEKPEVLKEFAKGLGIGQIVKDDNILANMLYVDSMEDIKENHQFVIKYLPMAFMSPEGFIAMIRRLLEKLRHKHGQDTRLVIDAVSDFDGNYPRLTGVPGFFLGILNVLFAEEVTTLFLYDKEEIAEKSDDETIVHLVDNAFSTQIQVIEGRRRVLFQPKRVTGSFSVGKHVFYIDEEKNGESKKIKATSVTGEYYVTEKGELKSADLRLFVNKCTPKHEEFNQAICRSFSIPTIKYNLDQELAHSRYESVLDFVTRLEKCKNSSFVVAVDTAYLTNELLDHFVSLKVVDDEKDFIDISHKSTKKPLEICKKSGEEPPRVLPIYIDCSLMLCNQEILEKLCDNSDLTALSQIYEMVKSTTQNYAHELKNKEYTHMPRLPQLTMSVIKEASEEFHEGIKKHAEFRDFHFLGYRDAPNPEPLVCMFFSLLRANGIIISSKVRASEQRKRNSTEQKEVEKKFKETLIDFARFYLPGKEDRTKPKNKSQEQRANNCLFFNTWYSLAVSDDVPGGCVPVEFGEKWKGVVGGWCWGVINNGLTNKGEDVVKYATGEVMNGFVFAHKAGVPPRKDLCHETGILSMYNLGLIKNIIEKETMVRARMENYPYISAHANLFFLEFISFVKGLKTAENIEKLCGWLDWAFPVITEHIQIVLSKK